MFEPMSRRTLFEPPPIPAPARADSRSIVEAVIDAAIELGPDATMAEIADRAGVGAASLHRYFPTTTSIYAEVSRQMYRNLKEQIRETLEGTDDALAAVHRVIGLAFGGPNVSLDYRRRLNLDIPLSWSKPTAEGVYKELLDEMTTWLVAHHPHPPADLSARVFGAFAMIRGAVLMLLLYPELAPPSELTIEHLTESVTVTLGFHPASAPHQ